MICAVSIASGARESNEYVMKQGSGSVLVIRTPVGERMQYVVRQGSDEWVYDGGKVYRNGQESSEATEKPPYPVQELESYFQTQVLPQIAAARAQSAKAKPTPFVAKSKDLGLSK